MTATELIKMIQDGNTTDEVIDGVIACCDPWELWDEYDLNDPDDNARLRNDTLDAIINHPTQTIDFVRENFEN